MSSVDTPVIVSDISNRGLETALLIKNVIESHSKIFKYKNLGLVLNRVRGQEQELYGYIEKTGLKLFGFIPEDENITRYDLKATPLLSLPDDSPAYVAAVKIVEQLLK